MQGPESRDDRRDLDDTHADQARPVPGADGRRHIGPIGVTDGRARHHVSALPPTRLSAFIRENLESILDEWETFARTLPQGEGMDVSALRDHAKDMLTVIVNDLDDPQTLEQQTEKAHGESDAGEGAMPTAAQEHGAGRAESGFTVGQMVAEFRALRASVMRLWSRTQQYARFEDLEDMTRFNEAI